MNKNLTSIKVIVLVLIILAIIIGGIFIGKSLIGSNDDTKKYNIDIKGVDGIETKAYISPGESQVIVSIINKSGKMIGSGYINVRYYDENGNKIIVVHPLGRYNMFENGKKIVVGFELPTNDNDIDYYIPAKIEVEVTMDEEYQEQYATIMSEYTENFSYSYYSSSDSSIALNLKNNGSNSDKPPRCVEFVFYKNNRPVYAKEISFYITMEPGETVSKEFDIPIDYKKSKEEGKDILIDYDSIEIYRVVEGDS